MKRSVYCKVAADVYKLLHTMKLFLGYYVSVFLTVD